MALLPLERLYPSLAGKAVMPHWQDITKDQPITLKDLVTQSIPEYSRNTYPGPPIGFAAMTVVHTNFQTGKYDSIVHGTLAAPRPVVAVFCVAPMCFTCRPPQPTLITVHETLNGRLPQPDPLTVKGAREHVDCSDWQCTLCTPSVNVRKMAEREAAAVVGK